MRICIPTIEDNGLNSLPYDHFGSARCFILHDTETDKTQVLQNQNEHHEHGACHPLSALEGQQVDAILVGGIGARALAKLRAAGIRIFQATAGTVRENVEAFQRGQLNEFTPETACRGHAHGHGHGHGHEHGHEQGF